MKDNQLNPIAIDSLIEKLHPVQPFAIHCGRDESAIPELKLMKENVAVLLAFTKEVFMNTDNPDAIQMASHVSCRCLDLAATLSHNLRKESQFFIAQRVYTTLLLDHYEEMAAQARRLCISLLPDPDSRLL